MLPERLSADLCSLRPDVDRQAVTVEVGPDGRMTAYRSLIRSRARLSYPQAERILAGEEHVADERRAGAARRGAGRRAAAGRAVRAGRGPHRVARAGVRAGRRRGSPRRRQAEESVAHAAGRGADAAGQPAGGRDAGSDVARAGALPRPRGARPGWRSSALATRLAALEVPTPPLPELHTPDQAAAYAAAHRRAVARYVRGAGRGRAAFPPLVLRALERARYDRPQPRPLRAGSSPPTATSLSPIRRYPDLVCHRALVGAPRPGAAGAGRPGRAGAAGRGELAPRARGGARSSGAATTSAWRSCSSTSCIDRGWDEPFEGEVVGMIEGAVFVRFGEVFEGLLPAGGWAAGAVGARPARGRAGRPQSPAAGCGWATRSPSACARSTVRAAARCWTAADPGESEAECTSDTGRSEEASAWAPAARARDARARRLGGRAAAPSSRSARRATRRPTRCRWRGRSRRPGSTATCRDVPLPDAAGAQGDTAQHVRGGLRAGRRRRRACAG